LAGRGPPLTTTPNSVLCTAFAECDVSGYFNRRFVTGRRFPSHYSWMSQGSAKPRGSTLLHYFTFSHDRFNGIDSPV
jgi:hypothetical protein